MFEDAKVKSDSATLFTRQFFIEDRDHQLISAFSKLGDRMATGGVVEALLFFSIIETYYLEVPS